MLGADATWPLQQGLLQHLKSGISLRAHFGKAPKILDQNEKRKGYPCLVLGNTKARTWSSATFDGQEHDLVLDLWTSGGGSAESKEIAGTVIDRLHNTDFPVAGHALVDLQFSNSETRYMQEKGVFHCRLCFKALTVSD